MARKRSSNTPRRRTKRRIARPMRNLRLATSVFNVKQKTFIETWTFSSAAVNGFWRYYSAYPSQMTNYTQHSVVFDEYRITGISYEFRPQFDNFSPDNSLWSSGTIHTIVDPMSNTVPSGAFGLASVNTFLEQGNVKSQRFGTVVSKYMKPKVATQVSGGGLSGRFIAAPWLRTDDLNVEHRGMHVYLQQNDSTLLPVKYNVYVTHYIQFRGHR